MQELNLLNTGVRVNESGLYSLNDLHKAAGGEAKHQPSNFLRMETTQELISEIEKDRSSDSRSGPDVAQPEVEKDRSSDVRNGPSVSVTQGGSGQGTYVAKELVYAYAMWVSAPFMLKVTKVLDEIATTGSYALDRWFSVREACVFVAPLMAPYGGVPLIPRSIRNLVMPFVNVPEVTRNAIVCGGDVYVKEAYIEQAVCFALTQHQTGMVQPRFYHDLREWLTTQVPLNRVQVLEYNQALTPL